MLKGLMQDLPLLISGLLQYTDQRASVWKDSSAVEPCQEGQHHVQRVLDAAADAGRTVRGIIEGDSIPDVFIPQLVDLWHQGRFPFDKLVRFFPLEQINEAVAAYESG